MQAVTQNFPRSRTCKMVNDFLFQGAHVIPYGTGNGSWNVIFVGEIKLCLDHSATVRQSFRPRLIKPRQAAGCLFGRKAALHLRLSRDEIRETFDLHKIHSPIRKGAAREFPSLCRAKTFQRSQSGQNRFYRCATAMDLQLRTILTGKGIGSGEEQYEAVIQPLTIAVSNRK